MAEKLVNKLELPENRTERAFHTMEQHLDRLDRLLYQPGPQATSTDFDSLGCTFYEGAYSAEIRTKDPFSPIIGMTDIISN